MRKYVNRNPVVTDVNGTMVAPGDTVDVLKDDPDPPAGLVELQSKASTTKDKE